MQIIQTLKGFREETATVLTIGKFDGIHRGHQRLIERTVSEARARREAGEDVKSCVCAIGTSPVMLLSLDERRQMLADMGVDLLIEETLTPELIRVEPEDFIASVIREKLRAVHVVTGEDFRYGYGRRGDTELLGRVGKPLGFTTESLPPVTDARGEKISSSAIRDAVSGGLMEQAAEMLGYPFFVTGHVIHGRQLGRTIGIPTANLIADQSKLLPPNGVYCSETDTGERVYNGITNVGTKPTVDGHFIGVETFCFDCDEDLYGEKLTVRLLTHVRKERKFDNLEVLKAQIESDRIFAETYFRKHLKEQEG